MNRDSTLLTIDNTWMRLSMRSSCTATGVAAKYLARTESKTVTVCGCGNQGRISVQALSRVLSIEKVFAVDPDLASNAEGVR
jgi:ornithine cyclodeaminase/alanine dehydrogenase-like protein (mu-crystallin family)